MNVFPAEFSIGPVRIAPATVLAPMAGVTDTVFRRFIRNLGGCGLIMTEFTSSHGVSAARGARKPTKTLRRYLAFEPEEQPLSAQLFGSDPAVMADAARVCEALRLAEDCGLQAIALHPRTREQGYAGRADWSRIAEVKASVKIPVIGNGDIVAPVDAVRMVRETGCDAVMIGRAASSNPWIFRQIEQYLATGAYEEPGDRDRYDMMRGYYTMLLEREELDTTGKMKQFATYFTHGIRHGAQLRAAIYQAKRAEEILAQVDEFFVGAVTAR